MKIEKLKKEKKPRGWLRKKVIEGMKDKEWFPYELAETLNLTSSQVSKTMVLLNGRGTLEQSGGRYRRAKL